MKSVVFTTANDDPGRTYTRPHVVADGASRFGCVGGNVIAYDPNEAPESMRKELAAFAKFTDGVESEIAASKIAFAIENPWRWHVCRRGRLWRKRARSAT